jgi:tRNA threonylcarbamoyladenosine biosynthesis protein TsaE
MVFVTDSPQETMGIAEKIAHKLKTSDIVAYFGGLGMGKTTFTHGLARGLGLTCDVSSPTFTFVNEYKTTVKGGISLYHFDMYRITSGADLESIGFYDYPLSTSVFAIEWAENVVSYLPKNIITVTFEQISEMSRKITFGGNIKLDTCD